jgi:hypothetical protein
VPWWGCHLEAQALAFTLMFVFVRAFPFFFNSVHFGYSAGIRSSLTVCGNREHHEKVEFDIWLREAVFYASSALVPLDVIYVMFRSDFRPSSGGHKLHGDVIYV